MIRYLARIMKALALLCIASLIVVSCGLEQYVYLYPPVADKTDTVLTFKNNPANDPAFFFGYRLLYRFCTNEAEVSSKISNVVSQFASSPTAIYAGMKNLGFRDLKLGGPATDLIVNTADRQGAFSFTIDFTNAVSNQDGSPTFITISDSGIGTSPGIGTGLTVYRTITGQSGDIGFSYNERDKDLGYDDLGSNFESGYTYLLLYVIAIGYNSTIGEIYSEPKYFVGTNTYIKMPVKNF